jgi:hypothetical protein
MILLMGPASRSVRKILPSPLRNVLAIRTALYLARVSGGPVRRENECEDGGAGDHFGRSLTKCW